jgi:2-polyprenyl-3-methyl-5-hydroxy-6-metoxy-1,4-benzoquinol methylase
MLQRLRYEFRYLGRPPWDRGVSPPELERYIQQSRAGRAVDLGCGTGTNAITLAQAGWKVLAVDYARGAVRKARSKAAHAGVQVEWVVGDVTEVKVATGSFDLALDIGCFHGVHNKARYLAHLAYLLRPGGDWLLYGFHRAAGSTSGPGLTADDLQETSAKLHLIWRADGTDQRGRASSWFLFRASR